MSQWLRGFVSGGIGALIVALVGAGAWWNASRVSDATFARMPDGRPSLNGIWIASNTANWDIETHRAKQGPVVALGAAFSVPGGVGVVEGGELPYTPEARRQRDLNAGNAITRHSRWRPTRGARTIGRRDVRLKAGL